MTSSQKVVYRYMVISMYLRVHLSGSQMRWLLPRCDPPPVKLRSGLALCCLPCCPCPFPVSVWLMAVSHCHWSPDLFDVLSDSTPMRDVEMWRELWPWVLCSALPLPSCLWVTLCLLWGCVFSAVNLEHLVSKIPSLSSIWWIALRGREENILVTWCF